MCRVFIFFVLPKLLHEGFTVARPLTLELGHNSFLHSTNVTQCFTTPDLQHSTSQLCRNADGADDSSHNIEMSRDIEHFNSENFGELHFWHAFS